MTELGKMIAAEGRNEGKIEIAEKAIQKGSDDEDIRNLTGLTLEEIKALRKFQSAN